MGKSVNVFLCIGLFGLGAALFPGCGPSETAQPEREAAASGRAASTKPLLTIPGKEGPCPCELGQPCDGDCKGGGKGRGKEACGCKSHKSGSGAPKDGPVCVCDQGKAGAAVWCKKCGVGYVKGEKVSCESCVKAALDAHQTGP